MVPIGNEGSPATSRSSPPRMEVFDNQILCREAVSDLPFNFNTCVDSYDSLTNRIVAYLAFTLYPSLEVGQKER